MSIYNDRFVDTLKFVICNGPRTFKILKKFPKIGKTPKF